jgi:hypothetical protein
MNICQKNSLFNAIIFFVKVPCILLLVAYLIWGNYYAFSHSSLVGKLVSEKIATNGKINSGRACETVFLIYLLGRDVVQIYFQTDSNQNYTVTRNFELKWIAESHLNYRENVKQRIWYVKQRIEIRLELQRIHPTLENTEAELERGEANSNVNNNVYNNVNNDVFGFFAIINLLDLIGYCFR